MPAWRIAHHPTLFTDDEECQSIAKAVTQLYVERNIPDHYVEVIFAPINPTRAFHAGLPAPAQVLINISHGARSADKISPEDAQSFKDAVDRVMGPYTLEKGIRLEYGVVDAATTLWRIDGVDPPEAFGEEEVEKRARSEDILKKLEADRRTQTA